MVVVDSAHGFDKKIIEAIKFIEKTYPQLQVIGGNIATAEGAKALIDARVDALRVGMGPGAICTTRIVSGMGVPQLTALRRHGKSTCSRSVNGDDGKFFLELRGGTGKNY